MSSLISAVALLAVSVGPGQTTKADKPKTVHLVSKIDTKDFGAETIRIGDLNGDGGPDLLFVQCVHGPRIISCLTATTIYGEILWRTGQPSGDNGRAYCDLPVQIYDWDRDGVNEVLYVRQAKYVGANDKGVRERAPQYEGNARMIVLDGRTGKEESSFDIPAPADDSILFADLTGRGRREDLVVKDRYWNMWGVSHEGKVLWHWAGSTGHYPAIADVDGDGKDEVFVGFALIDHDGKILFHSDPKGHHQDAATIVRPADGRWRLLFGDGGLYCMALDGTTMWQHPLREAQHVVAGRFRMDSPLQFAVVDRTPEPTHQRDANAWAILYLYNLDGKMIWQRKQEKGAWAIATLPINWFGAGKPRCIFVYGHSVFGQTPPRPAVIYDGEGQIVDELHMQYSPLPGEEKFSTDCYGLAADVWGDSREEVLLFGARGACIFTNARPLELPTLYNETLYPGM
ncbi:MAG: hypothetical protein JXQ73_29795 [Phycisphaerae bacterium]|nr:hypothetical protein [Phycisphaerae bacterium]